MADGSNPRAEALVKAEVAGVTDRGTGPAVLTAEDPAAGPAPRWEAETRERVRAVIGRFAQPLADLVARDASEGDTRLLVTDFLCEGLGYGRCEDLTTECQAGGEPADLGVRIARQLVAVIDVRRCTTELSARHLRHVQMYAVNQGLEWMILTNGQLWQVWHLTPGLPVVLNMALEVDLLDESGPAQKAGILFYLSKEAFSRHALDKLWRGEGRRLRAVARHCHHQRHRYRLGPQGTAPPDWPPHGP